MLIGILFGLDCLGTLWRGMGLVYAVAVVVVYRHSVLANS